MRMSLLKQCPALWPFEQVLGAWVKQRTLEEVLAAMDAARVPCGTPPCISPFYGKECCAHTYMKPLPSNHQTCYPHQQ